MVLLIYNSTIPYRMELVDVFVVILRNNEKLPSLSLPLNLNLNYENLLFSGAKVLLFSYTCKFFIKKSAFFSKKQHYFAIFPFKVAALASKICTLTISPICLPSRGNTTVLY